MERFVLSMLSFVISVRFALLTIIRLSGVLGKAVDAGVVLAEAAVAAKAGGGDRPQIWALSGEVPTSHSMKTSGLCRPLRVQAAIISLAML